MTTKWGLIVVRQDHLAIQHLAGPSGPQDLIECFEAPGFRMRVGEILAKQKEIYAVLGVVSPT